MGDYDKESVIHTALGKILSALSRLLLKHSISAVEFIELFKRAYIETAQKELGVRGRPANKSKIAATTGISRKEVTRICNEIEANEGVAAKIDLSLNRNIRLIQAWTHDARYLDDEGQPLALPMESEDPNAPSFTTLAQAHYGDIPPKAAFQDLERTGTVSMDAQRRVSLQSNGFIPHQSKLDKWTLLGTDVKALIGTIEHNLGDDKNLQPPLYQRKVAFHRMTKEGVEYINRVALEEGHKILLSLAKDLPDYCVDDTEAQTQTTYFSGLGIYVFQEAVKPKKIKKNKTQ